ncbi:uncharacterized protein Z520_11349 [Fonsecaea multimorphosa CBS 102226]|uniref:Methyltransferase domain-containing protein n=1 Tax=Fonsecaea multimorphosa CBS 102226 TaxID=1442371 RepID=A0A0D2K946_9EURO|nr:uncharacterized protein Z520_11349 [Fonsecaea multimorphosa CBS 102226]KIX92873.1 hypothetical protein Z520_11349 [Fonsecaea multimorphosa CBS 102226]OAL18122.1 hypothetical protein AYO22_10899 [Fonsecaea multimorphosa]
MSHFSKTQYNAFSESYDAVNDLPISRAIVINVERLIRPHIRGKRVLELACGTGFFTRHMLDWGAASVVGVDVSQAMVDIATSEMARQRPQHKGKYRFMVADCSAPFSAHAHAGEGTEGEEEEEEQEGGGEFDLVFAAWLLNYAPDQPTMTAMFRNISTHLKPDGRFISVLPHPEDDPMVCIDRVNAARQLGYGYGIQVRKSLAPAIPRAYYVHLFFDSTPPVDFGNYYLPKHVHERAAREGGMEGALAWEAVTLPDDYDEINRYMKDPVSPGYFDRWLEYPDFGILIVEK